MSKPETEKTIINTDCAVSYWRVRHGYPWIVEDKNGKAICNCVMRGFEADKHAALIAAAPELLQACRNALRYVSLTEDDVSRAAGIDPDDRPVTTDEHHLMVAIEIAEGRVTTSGSTVSCDSTDLSREKYENISEELASGGGLPSTDLLAQVDSWLETWGPNCGAHRSVFEGQFRDTLRNIFDHIEEKAEANMMKTGKLEGMHYAALKDVRRLLEIPRANT